MQENFVTTLLPTVGSQESGGYWSNPSRITADDGSEASYFQGGGSPSKKLQASAFAIPSMPPGAVIDGIGINVGQTTTSWPPEISLQPLAINLPGSTTKTLVFNTELGGPTDKWGASSISRTDLVNLVVSIGATSIGGVSGSLYVDCVYLIIYWHVETPNVPADVPTRVDYKVYSNDGIYLGKLPDVTSKLAFSQDINSAGSSIEIKCGKFVENEVTSDVLLTEGGDAITTENDIDLLADSNQEILATGDSENRVLYKNGNRIKAWLYNYWYPNGKLVFSGQLNKIALSYGGDYSVALTVYSDGIDLDNYLLQPASSFSYTNDVVQTSQNASTSVNATIMGGGGKGGGPTNWVSLGQTFKTGAITRIGAIKLRVGGGGAKLIVTLKKSVNGAVLGTAYATPGTSTGDVTFYFPAPVNVTASTTYFFSVEIDMTNQPKDTTASATVYRQSTNVYADGAAYQSTNSSPAWSTSIGGDLYFITQSASLGNTTVTYTSEDPVTGMIAPALTDYNTRGGLIKARNLTAAGLSLTYSFNSSTIFEVINKALEISPVGYYSYVDLGTAEIDIANASETADFLITRGKNINTLDLVLTIENVKNNLLFSGGELGGGDNLLKKYDDALSVSRYGSRSSIKSDNRVTVTGTADAVGQTYIEENAGEQHETSVTVFNTDIDITKLTPGKTVGFRNFGSLIDGLVLQISRREYNPHSVTLTLGRLPVRMNDAIAAINLALKYQETQNNPTSPS